MLDVPAGPTRTILARTLAAAIRDEPTVTPTGRSRRKLIHGVRVRRLPTLADARGNLAELIDERWGFHPAAVTSAYMFSIRPGVVKGWSLHRAHEDRYAMIRGEMELVLYDPRPDSPTCGEVCRLMMTEHERCLVSIPVDVWHADHNVGTVDSIGINFPTRLYDHANPDKYRLPIDTDLIPFSFGPNAVGG